MLGTFMDTIEAIFGEYEPIINYDTGGNVIDTSVNLGYVAGVLIFSIALYFTLKTVGGVLYEWLRR